LRIKVDLLGGGGIDCDPPPGRIFIVGPAHTFEELAEAINCAFARWDRSHLHEFELADGRLIGYPDDTFEPDVVWLDQAKLKVCREVRPGDEFEFTFDLGDNWRHRCIVDSAKVDPVKEYGAFPRINEQARGGGLVAGSRREEGPPATASDCSLSGEGAVLPRPVMDSCFVRLDQPDGSVSYLRAGVAQARAMRGYTGATA
jgi:hypothetical protein